MKQKTRLKIIFGLSALFMALTIFSASAETGSCPSKANYDLEIKLPFISSSVCGPAEYLVGLYKLAVGVAVALAVVLIVYAGILYLSSGDNPNKQKEAKSQITQAILGLVILLASYLILNTINPDLVNLGALQNKILNTAGTVNISPPPGMFVPNVACTSCLKSLDDCRDQAARNARLMGLYGMEECEKRYDCSSVCGGGGGGGDAD